MKKKLEAELMSIAHRILKMKNKSDLVQLQQEAQKLYEKLSVLRFVEENLSDVKPTIGYTEIEDKLAVIFDNDATDEETSVEVETPKSEENKEAISDLISGITEKAKESEPVAKETPEVEPETNAEPEEATEEPVAETTEESVAELESPEEVVAPVEAEATAEAEAESKPEKIEEPAQEVKAEETKSDEKQDALFKPAFEWGFEPKAEETKSEEPKITPAQISFDDLLGQDYVDPVFVKPEEVETPMPKREEPIAEPAAAKADEQSENDRRAAELAESNRRLADLREAANRPLSERNESKNVIPISRNFSDTSNVISINKENLNDRISKGITIGLNDRIAFMKHLFDNSSEDYNRVLSQLITFDTLPEAKDFIDNVVKPDYNNWEGKDEYEQRFMEIIEKKFA